MNWMEEAEQLGLALYERQVGETDEEYARWVEYASHYPGQLPRIRHTATAAKWAWPVRIQAYIRYIDAQRGNERIAAIQEADRRQAELAAKMLSAAEEAIAALDPTCLTPNEIVQLARTASSMQSRAVEKAVERSQQSEALVANTAAKPALSTNELNEVVRIMQEAGVVGLTLKTP